MSDLKYSLVILGSFFSKLLPREGCGIKVEQ